jgi:hypothetical protein
MSNQTVNVISAEQDASFHKLNVDNIVVEVPKTAVAPGQKGVWVNIKYKYGNGKKDKLDKLKIQTSELFSYGISRYEESSPAKMCLVMVNRKLREAQANDEAISEEDLEDIKVEDATVKMLDDIIEKVKEAMKEPEMITALGKQRDKKWISNVDGMEIVKRKGQENGIDAAYVYAKVVTTDNFMKTKFLKIDENEEEGVRDLNQDETVEKLSQKDVNCRATFMIVVDSVFVGKEPYIQVKLSEAVVSEFIEYKPKRNIIMPARFRNKTTEKKSSGKAKLDDSDESDDDTPTTMPTKKVIKDDSENNSDSD